MSDYELSMSRRGVLASGAIGAAATRGSTLTQQLLAFARKQELRDRLLNFNSLLGDFRPVVQRTAGEGTTVKYRLDDNLWNCRIDPVQAESDVSGVTAQAQALDTVAPVAPAG